MSGIVVRLCFRPLLRPIKVRIDPEACRIVEFVKYAFRQVEASDKILDAGAGNCPHRKYLAHATWEFCDIVQNRENSHTFLCDLQNIPRPGGCYDDILNIQVLDDLPYPQEAINEFFRILRLSGSLFLTAPRLGFAQ